MSAAGHVSWWAVCDACFTTIRIESHPEREEPVPDTAEWDDPFMCCPVCGCGLGWNSDPQVIR